ncbi:MAG: helix-hairpin-helix domain-containing protein [Candidatus Helarchaeales archaeon]
MNEGIFLAQSKEQIISELQQIKGVDKKIAIALYNANIRSLNQLEMVDVSKLSQVVGIDETTIRKWIKAVPDVLSKSEIENSIQILSEFLEIPEETAEKLRNVGVFSIKQLAEEDPQLLADDVQEPVKTVLKWIKKARSRTRQNK